MGGYNVLRGGDQLGKAFSKTYTNLPSHTMIYFTLSFWAIDSWNKNLDYFEIQLDNSVFTGWNTWDSSTFVGRICGDAYYSDVPGVRLFGRASHSDISVTFSMLSDFDQESTNESLGFRNLNFLFVNNVTDDSEMMCGRAPITIKGAYQCSCIEGQYQNSTGTCLPCHYSCGSCFAYGSNSCFQCATGYGFDGDNCVPCDSSCLTCYGSTPSTCSSCYAGYTLVNNSTCVDQVKCTKPLTLTGCNGRYCDGPCAIGQFLYWNSTCLPTCNFPLQQKLTPTKISIIGSVGYCIYPCSSTKYLYWDGVCRSSCPSPYTLYVEADKNYCIFPCATGESLYWNRSCIVGCEYPLVKSTVGGRISCEYPCTNGKYLYPDRSCSSTCDPLFKVRREGGENFCDFPCGAKQVLYWNSSCLTTCNFPLTLDIVGGESVCRYPCTGNNYLYPNATCLNHCNPTFHSRIEAGEKYCDSECGYKNWILYTGNCTTSCPYPLRSFVNYTGEYCILPCDKTSDYFYPDTGKCESTCTERSVVVDGVYNECLVAETHIVRLLQHIKYLDVTMPTKLTRMRVIRGNNILSIRLAPSLFDTLSSKIETGPLASVFQKRHVNSSFLVNFIDDLVLLAAILFLECLLTLAHFGFKKGKYHTPASAISHMQVITRFNLPIMLIATNIGDIFFFSILEFRFFDSSLKGANVSLAICIIVLIITITFISFLGYIVYNVKKTTRSGSVIALARFVRDWRSSQVIFGGQSTPFYLSQTFFLIYTIRLALPMIIAAAFFMIPIFQAALYLAINIVILIYIIRKRPIKSKFNKVNVVLIEIILFLANLSALVLCILDFSSKEDHKELRSALGMVIIVTGSIIEYMAIAFLIGKIVLIVLEARRARNARNSREKSIWLQMLFISFHQGGMCFEEVQVSPPLDISEISEREKARVENMVTELNTSTNLMYSPRSVTDTMNVRIHPITPGLTPHKFVPEEASPLPIVVPTLVPIVSTEKGVSKTFKLPPTTPFSGIYGEGPLKSEFKIQQQFNPQQTTTNITTKEEVEDIAYDNEYRLDSARTQLSSRGLVRPQFGSSSGNRRNLMKGGKLNDDPL